ncbi:MAG: Calx-beta domain-containing protein [Cyanobacteriota bacterium]|nr:Calx-beta domain-containing protein [Cyanobacteriota bacterium]
MLLSADFATTATASDLTLALVSEYVKFVQQAVFGSLASSDMAERHTTLILEEFPIEKIMILASSDRIETAAMSASAPGESPQNESQASIPQTNTKALGIQSPAGQAHDHEHEEGELCTEGLMPGELLSGNPPIYTAESSLASFAELSQQTPGFIPASVAGSVVGQPGLVDQLPLVQAIAVVGAVRNGSLQISNSANVAIQATLGRALGAGESLRYSLDAGASWTEVPATASSAGTSVLIGALVLPLGSSSLNMACFAPGRQGQISRQEIVVDAVAPTAAVSTVLFNEINGELILTGTQFTALLSNQEGSQANLLTQLDWSKLSWQTAGNAGAQIGFSRNDIEAVTIASDQQLLIRLTTEKRTQLLTTIGYGSLNTLSVAHGFLRDEAGNSATQIALISSPITLLRAASGVDKTMDGRDNIDLLFASTIARGSGEFRLHGADGMVIERFDAATSSALRLEGNRLRLDPSWALIGSQSYSMTFDAGSLLDGNGAAIPGIIDVGLLQFTAGTEIGKVNGAAAMRDQWPGSDNSEAIGNHKMLYMPITFLDVDRDPTSERDMHVFDVVDTATFFRANSQGAMPFNADYSPLITLPYSYTWYRQFEAKYDGLGMTANAGKAEALALGFDSSQYNVSLIRADLNLRAGVAWANPNTVWLPWGGQWVMSHETAHALGLGHPPAIDVNGVSQGLNTLDVMGVGYGFNAHVNVDYKRALGWIEAAADPLNPGPGIYRIHATDQGYRVAGQNYSLRLDLASDALGASPRYSVEYRKTSGTELANSLLVYRNGSLIDLNPDNTLNFTDAGIKIGQTFQLPGTQTYFTVLGKGDGYIDFSYQQGPFPGNIAPQAILNASATTVARGDQISFSATATDGNDDALSYLWRFSDGISGSGSTFTRSFTQSTATAVTATLTVSDGRGGINTQVLTINAGATSTGSPQTVGSPPATLTPTLPQVSVQASQPFAREGGADAGLTFRRTGADLSQPLTILLQYGGSAIPTLASAWSLLDSAYPTPGGVLRPTAVRVADLEPSQLTFKLGGAAVANTAATANVRLDTVQRTSGSLRFWVEAPAENKAVQVQLMDAESGIVTAVLQAKTLSTIVIDTGLESVNQGGLSVNSGQTFTTAASLQGVDRLESISVRGPQSGALGTVLTMKVWENNGAAGTWSPGTLVATSTNSSVLANNANAVFNFNGARLDANKVYLISFSSGASDHVAFRPGITNLAGKTISNGALFSGGAIAFSNAYDLNFRVTLNAASSGPGVIDWNTSGTAIAVASSAGDLGIGVSEAQVLGGANLTETMRTEAFVPSRDVNNFTGLPTSVVIPVGQSEVNLNLTTINDAVIEPTKTLNVSIASDNTYSRSSQNSTAAITLLDDDTTVVTIEAIDSSAKEGSNDSGLFKLTRTGSLDQALKVYYTLGGTALNGGDFARLDGQIDFRAGDASTYLSVVPFDDALGETDETVIAQLTSFNQSYSIGSAYEASVNIQDNNDLPVVGLRLTTTGAFYQPTTWRINEGQSLAAIFDVTGGDGSVIDVEYTIGGSASNAVDYKALSGTISLQTGGNQSVPLNIDTILDGLQENNELVELTLKPGSGYKVAAQSSATIEIGDPLSTAADDDRFQVSGYHFAPIEGSTGLSKEARFFIHREEEGGYQGAAFTRKPATITYSLLGSAAPGVDYTNGRYLLPDDSPLRDSSGTAITFAPATAGNSVTLPGDTRGIQVVFDVVDDSLAEGTETMTLRLDSVSGNGPQYRFGRITQADYLLTDNDQNPVQVGFEVASTLTSEQDDPSLRTHLVAVTLNQASSQTVRVDYESYGGTATGLGADYTLFASPDSSTAAPKGTLVFTPGTTKQWIKVQVAADPIQEDLETVKLRLINPVASSLRSGAGQHTITIDPANNSTSENRYVRFVTSESIVAEGDPTSGHVIVILDRPAATPITVVVKAMAVNSNASSADYQLLETLNFAPGEMSKAVSLQITADAIPEGTERLSLQLASAHGALIIGPQRHDLMIRDAGAPLPGSLTASVARSLAAGTIIGALPVTLAAGRSVSGWRILQGNISAAGETTAAFSINAQGQLVLANPAALPLGNYKLNLVVEAEDDLGSRGSSALNIRVGDGAAGRAWAADYERVLAPTALGSISIDSIAVTDSGISATIASGELTRDRSLGLSGTAPSGHLVRVFSGLQLVGSTTAAVNNTWSLTTAALGNGAHSLRAEVSDRFGTIGITAPVSFTVRGTLELDSAFLLSRDPAGSSAATSSSNPVLSVKGISPSDQGVVAYETASGLLVADGRTGVVQIASRSATSAAEAAAASSSFSALSADGRYVLFSSSQPGGFGNNGVAFSDSNPVSSSPGSDLLVFDRNDASLRLLTSRDTATRTASKQAQLLGISSDSRYAVYTTDHAELIGDFTATSKPAASWTLVDGGFPTPAGKSKTTGVRVADLDPSKMVFKLNGSSVVSKDQLGVVRSDTIQRSTGRLQFWVESSVDPLPKAVKIEITDSDSGLVVKALESKSPEVYISSGNANNQGSLFRTGGVGQTFTTGSLAGSNLLKTISIDGPNTNAVTSTLYTLKVWENNGPITTFAPTNLVATSTNSLAFANGYAKSVFQFSGEQLSSNKVYAFSLSTGAVNHSGFRAGLIDNGTGSGQLFANTSLATTYDLAFSIKLDPPSPGVSSFDWETQGNSIPVATSHSAAGVGFSSLSVEGDNVSPLMFDETGQAASRDLIAYNLSTGERRLLSHAATAGDKNSAAAAVSDVTLSADGSSALFSVLDAAKLGTNGIPFVDASPSVKDWLAADLASGQLRLLSSKPANPNESAGVAMTLAGTSKEGGIVVFSVLDASSFGFTDSAPTLADLIAVNLTTGSRQLISRASSSASSTSAGQAASLELIQGHYAYFRANDATAFGFSSDSDPTGQDLFRFNLQTGALQLLSHASGSTSTALNGAYQTGSLVASPDGRYVYFAHTLKTGGGFTVSVTGTGQMIADMDTGAIRLLNSSNSGGDVLGTGAWSPVFKQQFTTDSQSLVWQTSYISFQNHGTSSDTGVTQYTPGIFRLDLSSGVKPTTVSQPGLLLSHSSLGNDVVAEAGNNSFLFLGLSSDNRLAYFRAANASRYGNDGVAFIDAAPSINDVLAVDLQTRKISLLTGDSLTSFAKNATFLSTSEAGAVLLSMADVAGLRTPAGQLSDPNGATGLDLLTWRSNLLALVPSSASANPSVPRQFQLNSRVVPGLDVQLLQDGQVVDRQTADARGQLLWNLSNVTPGSHTYTLRYPGEAILVDGADPLVASALTLSVTSSGNQPPTGSLTISGTPIQGQTLTAVNTIADLDGIPSSGSGAIAYQWKAAGALISGATGSTLVLTQAEVGKAITVSASYTDNSGTAEAITSAATAAVANINDSPTGAVTITGMPVQGQNLVLTNTLDDADGLGSFSYQWLADNTNIIGATSTSLLLTQDHVGKTITLTASYVDGGGTAETVTADATMAVANLNDAPTAISLSASAISENAPTDSTIGSLASTDPDSDDSFTYSLVSGSGSADNNLFSISGNILRANVPFNFESRSSYSVRLRSTDGGGLFTESPFSIAVLDVNEAPTGLSLANPVSSLAENFTLNNRYKLADIVITDDALGTNTFSLSGVDAGYFEVVGAALYLRADTSLNYAAKPNYGIAVSGNDASLPGSSSVSTAYTLGVVDVSPAVPTVNTLISSSATPTLSGSIQLETGGMLEVSINGTTYTRANGLNINGTSWSLAMPTALANGTYDVVARHTDSTHSSSVDTTSNELTIEASLPIRTIQVTKLSGGDGAEDNGAPGSISGTPTRFRISRSHADPNPLTVFYKLSGSALAGGDFQAPTAIDALSKTGSVTIAADATAVDLVLPTVNNSSVDGLRTITTSLVSQATYTIAAGLGASTASLIDNDTPPPPPTPVFSISDQFLVEGDTGSWITRYVRVDLNAPSSLPLSVDLAFGWSAASRPAATATSTDVQASNRSLTFAPGITSVQVPVLVMADTVVEQPAEFFYGILSNPGAGSTLNPSSSVAQITISDDDQGLIINHSAATASVNPIHGSGLADSITGSAFRDVIFAGNGSDTVIGGGARDDINLGGGGDVLSYSSYSESSLSSGVDSVDRVPDFDQAGGDRIKLSTLPAGLWAAGTIAQSTQLSAVQSVFQDRNPAVAGLQPLLANEGVLFLHGSGRSQRYLVAVNDATLGYQPGNDLLVDLTGANSQAYANTFASSALPITVANFFVI